MKKIFNWITSPFRTVNTKEWVEQSMSEKYGEDWLDQCTEALKDKEVRRSVRKELGLKARN